jgi:GTP-binding protein
MNAQFARACSTLADLPAGDLLEAAVAGRSNCGKSSLINAVAGAKLARTSSTPGRTQQLVFFHVAAPPLAPFHLVDLPGYGYARASKAAKQSWGELVTRYIDTRPALRVLVVLSDVRRAPAAEEQDLLRWARDRDLVVLVVLTKADKLSKAQRSLAVESAKRLLGLPRRPLACSIHDRESVNAVRDALLAAIEAATPPREDPASL